MPVRPLSALVVLIFLAVAWPGGSSEPHAHMTTAAVSGAGAAAGAALLLGTAGLLRLLNGRRR